ncbi:MAG TPA: phosphatidylserine decarboxylase family protein [Bacteroidales bacterium]|nr:phosphatidylserine decarboxylase family protein [Bacteroidales bacterium]
MKKMLLFLLSGLLATALSAQTTRIPPAAAGNIPYRAGQWLPSDQKVLSQWLSDKILLAEKSADGFHPVVEEFRQLIENDPVVFMLFHQMFSQVPRKPPYNNDPMGKPQIRDYMHMLQVINHVLTTAPEFNKTGLVGFPINAILDWPMGTPAGFAAFTNDKVNLHLKRILNAWGDFLKSPESRYVLNTDPHSGWFGKDAMEAMPGFEQMFVCDPAAPFHGFTCWDDFFTRRFREGQRPVASPGDDNVIANACESAPYKIARGVKARDHFWLKSQPYSLEHMLGGDPLADRFTGGTVYQAFLSALSYHRWHSPVSGRIVKTRVIDGTYYAENLAEGYDPAGPNESQSFITDMATRALVFIEADNPSIGLMCVVFVGMAEVSTCEVTVKEGQRVQKGDELGMFHFGGSTHCLVFRPEVKLKFDLHGQQAGLESQNIPVRSNIAEVLR